MIINLNLTENYVSSWGIPEALREIVQNHIDASKKEGNHDFYYDEKRKQIVFYTENSVLQPKSLALGYTTKAEKEDLIGKHGEGYKLAILVLTRNGMSVEIETKDINNQKNKWSFKFKKSMSLGLKTLEATILKDKRNKENNSSVPPYTKIIVKNCSEDIFNQLKTKTLLPNDLEVCKVEGYGSIIKDEKYKGFIFVEGIYVTTIKNLSYGYDLKSRYVLLERDRSLVSESTVIDNISCLLKKADDSSYLINSLKEETKEKSALYGVTVIQDLSSKNMEVVDLKEEVKEELVSRFKEEYGEGVLPVSSQSDFDLVQEMGIKPVIYTSSDTYIVQEKLKEEIDFESRLIKSDNILEKLFSFVEDNALFSSANLKTYHKLKKEVTERYLNK